MINFDKGKAEMEPVKIFVTRPDPTGKWDGNPSVKPASWPAKIVGSWTVTGQLTAKNYNI